jgi:hypothetical protein
MNLNEDFKLFLQENSVKKDTQEYTEKEEVLQLISFFYLNTEVSLCRLLAIMTEGKYSSADLTDKELLTILTQQLNDNNGKN